MELAVVNATQIEAYRAEARDLFTTNVIGVVSFTVLVWDHIITFNDEVQVIWKRKTPGSRGLLVYLFILLRYIAPLGFTVQLCSYFFSPKIWTPEVCRRYVVFEGCMTVSALGIVSLMMFLRVYALYARSLYIAVGVLSLFTFQFIVQGWLLSHAVPVVHSPGIYPAGCSMLFGDEVGVWAPASAYFPIIYDTVIFGLTLFKTVSVLRNRRNKPAQGDWIMRALLKDGALFYFVMLLSNIPLVIMIATAEPGIRNIAAQWEFLITVTLMCRITLSLRREDAAWSIGTTATQLAQTTLLFDDPQHPRAKLTPRNFRDAESAIGKRRSTTTGKRITSSLPATPDLDDDEIELGVDVGPWHTYSNKSDISSSSTVVAVHIPARDGALPQLPPEAYLHVPFPSPILEVLEDEASDYFTAGRRRIDHEEESAKYFTERSRRRTGDGESDLESPRIQFASFSSSSIAECSTESARDTATRLKYDSFLP
ncbi:hypothetical protein BKA62DRAFT_505116 [Auriculariales sp. MPI-PUGE-AT-0066]|nr:hypothetical protein BKA62DRAFT_505116 [Auriculariales sp. MPI-PUGE-AT-0066]